MKFQNIINSSRAWLSATPERALDAAYRAAIKIKAIEDDHFNGKKVSSEEMDYSPSVIKVFQDDVNNYLNTIKVRLTEFKISRSLLIFSDTQSASNATVIESVSGLADDPDLTIIEKLDFIDSITTKYQDGFGEGRELNLLKQGNNKQIGEEVSDDKSQNKKLKSAEKSKEPSTETIINKTSVLPRSFMRTIDRLKQEIDPQADTTEEAVLKKFRRSRNKTAISIRFLLILIIVPLFTHQFTKTFLISPFVEKYFTNHQTFIFINKDLEEEAFMELHRYEENLYFKSIIGLAPPISDAEVKEKVHDKAEELAVEYRDQGISAVGNVFADFFSLLAFAIIIFLCKREILIIKSFLDEIIYGLSDSAKAFLIILLTDMFVGYHSPHGWEIILEGIARHLGLPENRDFNFLFIATFPVILDTVLKYWIFRYLNRISPSSVATYKNMNE
ncbi:MAG: proton extrusion protein PcxA [Xenococcaceae cyanobacterium MO_188.B19]|nr:proton extrusion protein PcxA [Xenococcaceae cyanobacterium MO_188.B19]